MKDNLGTCIANIRKKVNLTQSEFAEIMNVNNKTVSRWENNTTSPSVDELKRMMDAFDLSFDCILTGKIRNKNKIKKIKRIKIISFSFIIFIILSLLIYFGNYFIKTHHNIKLYEMSFSNDNFIMNTGYYLKGTNKNVLKLGDINILDNEIYNVLIEVYFNDDILFSSDISNINNIEIKKNIDIDNIYVNIIYEKNNEIFKDNEKITLYEVFVNDSKILQEETKSSYKNNDYIVDMLLDNNFKEENGVLRKESKNKDEYYVSKSKVYYYYEIKKDKKYYVSYRFNYDILSVVVYDINNTRLIYEKFNYYSNDNNLICEVGKCNNYEIYYNEVMNSYNFKN